VEQCRYAVRSAGVALGCGKADYADAVATPVTRRTYPNAELDLMITLKPYSSRRTMIASALFLSLLPAVTTASPTLADNITVNISLVRALDRIDALSAPDLFARVTIAGEAFDTGVVRNRTASNPNWVVKKQVDSGVHEIKIEILDKDVTKNEPVDINRVDNKRDLDFTIDTKACKISGFSDAYRCGSEITREGQELKKAEITFSVNVTR
jgi:hypothetical protein